MTVLRAPPDESLEDLRILCTRFELHAQNFRDWVRSGGGPTNPAWARETVDLRRELHRAQCRAARRIHSAQQIVEANVGGISRCLGALQVYRVQQNKSVGVEEERLACAQAGRFERFGENDIAFVCDFCDGFLVWDDLRAMPTTRIQAQSPATAQSNDHEPEPESATSTTPATQDSSSRNSNSNSNNGGGSSSNADASPNWQAHGISMTGNEGKTIVFAPVAIANHLPPSAGEFRSRILCPYCDEYYYEEQGEEDMERVRYVQDASGFDSVRAFQEHLEWSHVSMVSSTSSCAVM